MSRGYEIYKKLKYGYFTWVANEPSRAEALNRVRVLRREARDGSRYVAVRKAVPSLQLITSSLRLRSSFAELCTVLEW